MGDISGGDMAKKLQFMIDASEMEFLQKKLKLASASSVFSLGLGSLFSRA